MQTIVFRLKNGKTGSFIGPDLFLGEEEVESIDILEPYDLSAEQKEILATIESYIQGVIDQLNEEDEGIGDRQNGDSEIRGTEGVELQGVGESTVCGSLSAVPQR